MWEYPEGARVKRLSAESVGQLILKLIGSADSVYTTPNHVWIPHYLHSAICKDKAIEIVFNHFLQENSINLHVVNLLGVVVLASCPTLDVPDYFVGFPTKHNKACPSSCLFITLPLKLKLFLKEQNLK